MGAFPEPPFPSSTCRYRWQRAEFIAEDLLGDRRERGGGPLPAPVCSGINRQQPVGTAGHDDKITVVGEREIVAVCGIVFTVCSIVVNRVLELELDGISIILIQRRNPDSVPVAHRDPLRQSVQRHPEPTNVFCHGGEVFPVGAVRLGSGTGSRVGRRASAEAGEGLDRFIRRRGRVFGVSRTIGRPGRRFYGLGRGRLDARWS